MDTSEFSPLDYFKLFFPDEAFELMCEQTNLSSLQFFDQPVEFSARSRFNSWTETTVSELHAYVALQIAMGLCQKNEIEDYWSSYWLIHTPFTKVMTRDRFEIISSFLHFADNTIDRPVCGQENYDPLWKIRDLLNICEPQYTEVYGPIRELSIDESIIKFKGRLHMKQYLPSKPVRWGIKQFALCESKTGYALKFITYGGQGSVATEESFNVTETICLKLLDGFLNNRHVIFMDNYSSPKLFQKLEDCVTGACGTMRYTRKNMPRGLYPATLPLNKGDEPKFMRCHNLVACAWRDTKRVNFLSNIHTNDTVDKRNRARGQGYRTVEKPVIAEGYNQHMAGVDIMDQKLETYAFPHKSSKWYFTIYHRIREVALVNGCITYTKATKEAGLEPMSQSKFREKVIESLLQNHDRPDTRRGRPNPPQVLSRLNERHFIGKFNYLKYKPDCIVCSDRKKTGWKRVQTNYKCAQYDLPMCFYKCHELYHTVADYRRAAGRMFWSE